jgi:hypothetical protein
MGSVGYLSTDKLHFADMFRKPAQTGTHITCHGFLHENRGHI